MKQQNLSLNNTLPPIKESFTFTDTNAHISIDVGLQYQGQLYGMPLLSLFLRSAVDSLLQWEDVPLMCSPAHCVSLSHWLRFLTAAHFQTICSVPAHVVNWLEEMERKKQRTIIYTEKNGIQKQFLLRNC